MSHLPEMLTRVLTLSVFSSTLLKKSPARFLHNQRGMAQGADHLRRDRVSPVARSGQVPGRAICVLRMSPRVCPCGALKRSSTTDYCNQGGEQ